MTKAQVASDECVAHQLQQAEMGQAGPVVQGRPLNAGVSTAPVVIGAVAVPATVMAVPDLPPEELMVLNYRVGLMCFSMIDLITTVLNGVSVWAIHSWWVGLLVFLFILGPICGLVGAQRLNRGFIAVYLACCATKAAFQIVYAAITLFLFPILLAVIEVWITKIVASLWLALGKISPERRAALVDMKEVPVRMVYW